MTDNLLKELAQVARERQRSEALDPRWEGLSAGTLSEADREALERLAAQDPLAASAQEAFRPLDAAARQRILARVEETLAPREPSRQATVLPFRKRVLGFALGTLAAAAAVGLFVLLPDSGQPPLPGYGLTFSGLEEVRAGGPEAEVPRLQPGSQLELLLRPSQPVPGPLEVQAFLFQAGRGQAWRPRMEISEEGAVRIRGPVEELLPLPPGEWTLALAVGRPGEVPTDPREVATRLLGQEPVPAQWHLLTRRFQLLPRP